MPKRTFFNLTEEKQQTIIKNSITAFSEAPFKEVKIARIIKLAGIPRTSFYDYFEDKFDLYEYILMDLSSKKQTYLADVSNEGDFFDRLQGYILAGLKFTTEEPEMDQIFKYFLKDSELIKNIFGEQAMDVSSQYEVMLQMGIDEGSIRKDIDLKFTARTLNILSSELMFSSIREDGISLNETLEQIAKHLVDFIKNGIKIQDV